MPEDCEKMKELVREAGEGSDKPLIEAEKLIDGYLEAEDMDLEAMEALGFAIIDGLMSSQYTHSSELPFWAADKILTLWAEEGDNSEPLAAALRRCWGLMSAKNK